MFRAEPLECAVDGCTLQTLILHEEEWEVTTFCPTHYEEMLTEFEEGGGKPHEVLSQEEWEAYMLTRSASRRPSLELVNETDI